jgi:hypothetical protein
MSWQSTGQGAAAGAAVGSQIMPGWGTAIGAVLGGLFNSGKGRRKAPKVQSIDTSSILAEIDKLYAAQEQATQANLARGLSGMQAQTSESLAGRGIYSSPVSEWSFAKNRQAASDSLADAMSTLSANKASTKANVLSSASSLEAKQRYDAALAKYQNQIESDNMLTGLLASGAMSALGKGSTPSATGTQTTTPYTGGTMLNEDLLKLLQAQPQNSWQTYR